MAIVDNVQTESTEGTLFQGTHVEHGKREVNIQLDNDNFTFVAHYEVNDVVVHTARSDNRRKLEEHADLWVQFDSKAELRK